jgi:hypothetical protein
MTEQPPTAPTDRPPPPPPTAVSTADRPSGVTTASAILAILGVVCLLLGVTMLLFSSAANQYTPAGVDPNVLGAGAAITGIFYLLFGVVQIAGAVLSWGGRDPGRWLGLAGGVVGVIVAILAVLALLVGANANDPNRTIGLVVWIVLLLAWALTVYSLWQNSDWFTRSVR